PERGGRDDDEFGVVVDPRVVVCLLVVGCQGRPGVFGQQVERGGRGVDEMPPSAEGGGGLAAFADRLSGCFAYHHRLASSSASNTPSGMTGARAPSSVPAS